MLQILCKTPAAIFKIQIPANTKSKFNNLHANIIHQKHQFHYHWWANLSSSPPSHGSDVILTPKISMVASNSLSMDEILSHIAEIFT